MILLLAFAFLAGIVTILSPCILPILPVVLSGTVGGGKRKPLGIITGFIASFTFFTLFLSILVRATGISPDVLRSVSVVMIFTFGLSLLVPQAQVLLERLFSKLSGLASSRNASDGRTDFIGGIFLGASLGLIWTPCVGPILASVISLALTGTVTTTAFLITIAYATGTAIPMLAITYGGRSIFQKVPWLLGNTPKIQKTFGVLMILTALAIAGNFDRKFQTYILDIFPEYGAGLTAFEDNPFIQSQLQKLQGKPPVQLSGKPMFEVLNDELGKAQEFIAGGRWYNSEPLTIAQLRGNVVLVDFWTYTCINCIRTLPYLKAWHQKYKDKGLVIVGVHTPEFEFEKNPKNVENAIKDFGLEYPIMQDNDYATWRAYANRYWPAKYLIDKAGKIRYTHFGEGKYDETEKVVQELLEETGATVNETINNPTYSSAARTPELYLGYQRIAYLASPERIEPDKAINYSTPVNLAQNSFAFAGTFTIGEEYAAPSLDATLSLHFDAAEVFLVMRQKYGGQVGRVRIFLDGKFVTDAQAGSDVANGVVTVDSDRLYKLLNLPESRDHILKLEFLDSNLELYAFTFG